MPKYLISNLNLAIKVVSDFAFKWALKSHSFVTSIHGNIFTNLIGEKNDHYTNETQCNSY